MKKYRTHLAAVVILLILLAVVLQFRNGSERHAATKIRNVIMISLDTTRADMWGFYGNEWIRTPNLDALAKESIVLDDFMTVAPTTLASHTSLFTGNYPHRHGVPMNGYLVNDENRMLAEIFRDEGFHTAAFVGSFALDSRFQIDQGFDIYDEQLDIPFSKEHEQTQRIGGNVTNAVIEHLDARKVDGSEDKKPLFLFAHYFDPHHPYEAPAPFGSMYAERAAAPDYASRADLVCGERHPDGRRMVDPPNRNSDEYAGEISYLDTEVGRLLDYLRKENILEESLIVITSDHGEQFWEHVPHFNHGRTVYQSVMRIVGMIRFPDGRLAGSRYTPLAANIDILPTILETLNITAPNNLDGAALHLRNPKDADPNRAIFCEATQPSSNIDIDSVWPNKTKTKCIRLGKYKYTWTPFLKQDEPNFRVEELFDLETDPCEQVNLLDHATPEIQSLRADLRDQLIQWMDSASPLPIEFDVASYNETTAKLRELGYIDSKESEADEAEPEDKSSDDISSAKTSAIKHVIFVSFDTTRPDHFGAYGNKWIETPALDAFAAEGIVFENARTVVPGTLPAHATLFTGTYPHTHGTPYNGFVVNDDNVMLAELLKGKGYSTKGFAASYPLNIHTNIQQGFDVWNQDFVSAAEGGTGQRNAAEVTSAVLNELDTAGIPENLFLFVHYFDPHSPYLEVQPWFDRYMQKFTSRENLDDSMYTCPSNDSPELIGNYMFNTLKYASEVSFMDANFGVLLEGLKSRGIYENALIMVTSDHGENFWEHEVYWDHGETIYDTSSHIVCIARLPSGDSAGTRIKGLISNVDFAPSILNAVGLPIPSNMEGHGIDWSDLEGSLVNRINFMEANQSIDHSMQLAALGNRGIEQTKSEAMSAHTQIEVERKASHEVPWTNLIFQRGVTDGRYKFIVTPYRNTEELYDLVADPCESDNLLVRTPKEEILGIADSLRTKLQAWDNNARPLSSTFDPVDRDKTINELREMGYF